jgi:prepilin-type processing-associated H-X9-DG protein
MLLPALATAREAARGATCKNNLRQFGIGLFAFADKDPQTRLCTGASDFRRDGCMDTWGWVADIVNSGAGKPSTMLCPSNPLLASEKVNDLLGKDTSSAKDGADLTRTAVGFCGTNTGGVGGLYYNGGTASTTPGAANFANTAINTPERATVIAWGLFEAGYNTNYVQSYFLARTAPTTYNSSTTAYAPKIANFDPTIYSTKGIAFTQGPLTLRTAESGAVPTSNIPLIGDASPGDVQEATLSLTIQRQSNDFIGAYLANGANTSAKGNRNYAIAGQLLTEAFNDGPSYYDTGAVKLPLPNADLSAQYAAELAGIIPPPTLASGTYLQDQRDFFALHGGKTGSCNILMADGAVKTFFDANGDKFLNPGFPVTPVNGQLSVGYTDGTIDLPPGECFSGFFLVKQPKGKFEQ